MRSDIDYSFHKLMLAETFVMAGMDTEDTMEAATTQYLQCKVHMSRCINDINPVIFPNACGSSRGDGNPPFLLLLHPIHGGSTFMYLPNLIALPCVIEHALCCCCLRDRQHQVHIRSWWILGAARYIVLF